MKRNEIALLFVVVGLVVMSTYFLLNALLGQQAIKPVNVPSVDTIANAIKNPPDQAIFNKDAINPAVSVTIGEQANQQPFSIGQ